MIPLQGVGIYTVKTELAGFQTSEAKDIRLQVDEHRELDFRLSPATVQTSQLATRTPGVTQETNPNSFFNGGPSSPRAANSKTATRTPAIGPGFVNSDFSPIEHFALPREGMRMDFRAEVFNLLNHPQFANPGFRSEFSRDVRRDQLHGE